MEFSCCGHCLLLLLIVIILFKVKQRGLLEKYDEEIEGEQKKSFVLGKGNNSISSKCFVLSRVRPSQY